MLAGILVYTLLAVMMFVLLRLFARGSLSSYQGASGAALTAFHDLQPADKQRAVEVIIEEKAGMQKESQKSGEGRDDLLPENERNEEA